MPKRIEVMAGNCPEDTPSGVSPPITLELHGSAKWPGFEPSRSASMYKDFPLSQHLSDFGRTTVNSNEHTAKVFKMLTAYAKWLEDTNSQICHENELLRYGLAPIATKAVNSLDEAAKLANDTLKAASL